MEGFPYLDEMEGYQPLLGPFLSILFMGFVVLVGLNMFIVILSDAFVKVQEELRDEDGDPVVDALRRMVSNVTLHVKQAVDFAKAHAHAMHQDRVSKRRASNLNLSALSYADFIMEFKNQLTQKIDLVGEEEVDLTASTGVERKRLAPIQGAIGDLSAQLDFLIHAIVAAKRKKNTPKAAERGSISVESDEEESLISAPPAAAPTGLEENRSGKDTLSDTTVGSLAAASAGGALESDSGSSESSDEEQNNAHVIASGAAGFDSPSSSSDSEEEKDVPPVESAAVAGGFESSSSSGEDE